MRQRRLVVLMVLSTMHVHWSRGLEPAWGLQHEHVREAGCGSWQLNATACRAHCNTSAARSMIILNEPTRNGAGLGDRMFIMSHAVALAKALCARVVVAPPHMMLSAAHNQGMHGIQCGWRWSRYFDMSAMPTLEDWTLPAKCQSKLSALAAQQRLAVSRGCAVVSDMSEAFNVFVSGRAFAFVVSMGDLRSGVLQSSCRLHLGALQKDGCSLGTFPPSQVALRAATSLVDRLSGGGKQFATLHIRRGDTIKLGCDTSPARVGLFLNCHLDHRNGSLPAIALLTDDKDTAYLAAVLEVLRVRSSGMVVHGDAALAALLEQQGTGDLDNYLVFVAASAVKARAAIQLEFGGHRAVHGPTMAEHCDRQVQCEKHGNFLLRKT